MLKCSHCKIENEGVELQAEAHSVKLSRSPLCVDRMACWRRWDEQNLNVEVWEEIQDLSEKGKESNKC